MDPMQKHSTNKVALITGAARRVGAEIATLLHQNGMNVILHYRTSEKEAKNLCAALNEKRKHSAIIYCANLLKTDGLHEIINSAVAEWGRLDALINNASGFYRTVMGNVTEQEWDDLLNSNLKAAFFLSQQAAPHLSKQQGCIVNIADIHAERPMRDYSVYCISKAGLIMLTKALAKELGPSVRVNAISPGVVAWPEGENTVPEMGKQKIIDRTVLKRHGDAKEIAKAVLFLVNSADFITGQVINIDGGRSLFI